jgi:branched-chain amino acid transport system permease protein
MTPALFAEFSLIGVMVGGVYALLALCFNFLFRATKVFNMATGAMMMIGAYLYYTATSAMALDPWPAAGVAILCAFVIGALCERILMRPMIGQPMIALVMVTVGLGNVLEGAASLIWGIQLKTLPALFPRDIVALAGIPIPGRTFWGFVLAATLTLGCGQFVRYARSGVMLRATASSATNAMAVGIDVPRVVALSWGLAAAMASVAGIVIGSVNGLLPDISDVALGVLAVVILAGLDSVVGVLVAGIIIGWLEVMAGAMLGGAYRDVVPYIAVLAIMVVRPYGLFGTSDVERI